MLISPLQLLPLALLSIAVAKDIDIDWFIPGPQGLDSVKAEVGDTLVFEWDSVIEHNVYLAPSDSCKNLDDGKKVGDKSPVEYKIREKDAGKTLTFACEIEGHCQAGQLVSVTVDDAPSEDEDDEDDDGEEETEDEKEETEDENEDEGSCKERRDKCEENDECCSNRCNNKGRCIAPKNNDEDGTKEDGKDDDKDDDKDEDEPEIEAEDEVSGTCKERKEKCEDNDECCSGRCNKKNKCK